VVHRGNTNNNDNILSAPTANIEMEYALTTAAQIDPYNESSWRYFIGILKEQILHLQDAAQVVQLLDWSLQKIATVEENAPFVTNDDDDDKVGGVVGCCSNSSHLLAAKIDILEWKNDPESLQRAVEIAETLASTYDTIRQKYWHYRIREIQQKQQQQQQQESSSSSSK